MKAAGTLLDSRCALDAYLGALLDEGAAPDDAGESCGAEAARAVTALAERPSFRVQLFEVANITLAVDLESLCGVVPADEMTLAQGTDSLLLGTLAFRGAPARVVDLARLVLPGGGAAETRAGAPGPASLLVVDGGRWALACRRIGEVVELRHDEVTWRSDAGKRPWLAGMVAGRKCALLDPEGLVGALAESLA